MNNEQTNGPYFIEWRAMESAPGPKKVSTEAPIVVRTESFQMVVNACRDSALGRCYWDQFSGRTLFAESLTGWLPLPEVPRD